MNVRIFETVFAICNKGTHAKKMQKVNGNVGHAITNNNPLTMLSKNK